MKQSKINWKCVHCGKRNLEAINVQLDIPNRYAIEWTCKYCGKDSKLTWDLMVSYPQGKAA